ncbi:MAG: type I 3-dehydroquinate dehydratase, partial [Planctomycetes bacterium]|nr:type I 3-dehydroquinate dehydratase [Planctomycetota bacterium]
MTVCVSLFGSDTEALCVRLRDLATRRKVVELRLDRLSPEVDLSALAKARGLLRIVLACVPENQGGAFAGTEQEWAEQLLAAAAHFAPRCIVDVPPKWSRPSGLAAEIPVLWSWHEPQGSNEVALEDIDTQLRARASAQDYRKIVAWADQHCDALRAVRLMQSDAADGRLIAFAQGPGSRASRVWALVLGAPWSYASWRGEATARGLGAEHLLPDPADWAATPLLGVIGDPIEHSKSPELWDAAFRATQCHASLAGGVRGSVPLYLRLQHSDLTEFQASYAADCFRAFSVTSPLKKQALHVADEASERAQQVGASNFLFRTPEGRWRAEQTDGIGALDPLQVTGLPEQAPILIVGAGGAARAVVAEALSRGHRVTVAARRRDAAQAMLDSLLSAGVTGNVVAADLAAASLLSDARGASSTLGIVQATPLGSVERPGDPLIGHEIDAGCWVLDMVYHPPETALLARAREAGATTVCGHHMLHAQMLEQFRLLTGQEASSAALLLALEVALGLPSPPILLCGPRASGKSTLGRWLAEVLD